MKQPIAKGMINSNIDGGWAWLLAVSAAILNFHIGGSFKLIGVLYVEFLDLFRAGPVITSWIGTMFGIMLSIGSLLGGYIADILSFQRKRIFLVFFLHVAALGVATSGWVSNVAGVIICFGMMTGFSVGIAAASIYSLPGIYFEKRRSLAYGVCFTGSTVSSLVMPILVTLLVQEYSLRGAMLIFAGFWLHTLIAPAAMTPVMRKPRNDESRHQNNKRSNGSEYGLDLVTTRLVNVDKQGERFGELSHGHSTITTDVPETEHNIHVFSSDTPSDDTKDQYKNNSVLPGDDDNEQQETTGSLMGEDLTTRAIRSAEIKREVKQDEDDLLIQSLSPDICHCTKLKTCLKDFCMSYVKIMSVDVMLLMFCLCCGYFAYNSNFLILPPLARELHMSKLEGAILVTLPNGPEFISRIMVGFLVDKYHVSKARLLIACYIFAGILGIVISFFRHNVVYLVYAVVYGVVGGTCYPLGIPMIMDVVKPEQYGKASGLFPVLVGLSTAVGPPILTVIAQQTGTFVNSMRLCAGVYLLGALVLYLRMFYNTKPTICRGVRSQSSNA